MLAADIDRLPLSVQPIVAPVQPLDLVLIEPSRHVISTPAAAFLELLREEAERLNQFWTGYFEDDEARA